ncbi:lactate utilization protein [Desulfovibrio sp. OttesenSCG-928-I05]|nr:lactate utilization protein [Desulfovibrio sp. OttesenSCG-928-I05]
MVLSPPENYWNVRLEQTRKALVHNGFAASIHADVNDASAHVIANIIPEAGLKSVGFGGSATVKGSGIIPKLKQLAGFTVLDSTDPALSREEVLALRRESLLADMYLTSSNAVTVDGKLVNLDKMGNRVASIHFGPRKVLLMVGRNKICADEANARSRVKEIATPINAMRLGGKTPCSITTRCTDCNTQDRICGVWTITEKCFPQGRIHVLLINQDLGY